jgi:motility quorum-sensing regulator/GCU-specific mRNA interferase toxin
MEKRKPHYRLSEIQAVVTDPNRRPFTVTALRNGLAMGLTEPEMRQVVRKLTRKDFYKAMTTHADHQVWQDVYHGATEEGISVYIKITAFEDDRPPVIQFKKK